MRITSILRLRFRSLLSRRKVELELDEELRYHLERQIEEGVATGMKPDDARYAALRCIKDIEQRKEECRDMRGLNLAENTVQDFRYAFRQLRKSPGFACTAVFVLGLGIAAVIAIFGFVDAALIRPLPYQSRLVAVFQSSPGYPQSWLSYLNFVDFKKLNRVFASMDAYALDGSFTLTKRSGAEQVPGTRVSAGFFRTLGVTPVLGRDFLPGEDSPTAAHTAIISYTAWQKRFGGNRDVLGRTVTLNGDPTTIIGVLPRSFQFALYGGAEFWGNLRGTRACEQSRGCHDLIAIARLKKGVSIGGASADMRSIARQLQRQYPESNRIFGSADLVPLKDLVIGDVRPVLLVLLSGAALLLLIACINVTTLLLAKSDKRQREIALRGALGASASRLFRQFASEGFVLAALACALALLSAELGMRLLVSLVPVEKMDSMPFLHGIGLTPLAIFFACAISILTGIIFAVIPALRTSFSGMMESLKEGARGSAGTTWRRFGSKLVIFEFVIAMVLMVGAGLLGRSLYALLHLDLGFRPDHLAVVQTSWDPGRYAADQGRVTLGRQIIDDISSLPGVRSVALTMAPPVDSNWGTVEFHIAGRPDRGEHNEALYRPVSSGYFTTLQAKLLRGRYFRADEDASKPLVVIVNQAVAKKYFPGEDPVGKQIYRDPGSPMEIIGVVDDIKEGPLAGANLPALYLPCNQNPITWPAVLVRTSQRAGSLLPEITQAIHRIDPFITVSEQQTMEGRINESPVADLHRSSAVLAGLFAAAAFLLSVVGLYGVIAYSVSQRTREIGVRMALGAERGAVYSLILSEAGRLVLIGIVAGIGCSLAAAALMRSLLFGVRPWDIPTLAAVAVILGGAALLASYLPARRAASVNPVEALRAE
jgi:macrolide transport system ATP-binding/permease protein